MNILILGNGFDLAHQLPTRYIDFIDFIEFIKGTTYDNFEEKNDTYQTDYWRIKETLRFHFKDKSDKIKELKNLSEDNF